MTDSARSLIAQAFEKELGHLLSIGAIDCIKINIEQIVKRLMMHVSTSPDRAEQLAFYNDLLAKAASSEDTDSLTSTLPTQNIIENHVKQSDADRVKVVAEAILEAMRNNSDGPSYVAPMTDENGDEDNSKIDIDGRFDMQKIAKAAIAAMGAATTALKIFYAGGKHDKEYIDLPEDHFDRSSEIRDENADKVKYAIEMLRHGYGGHLVRIAAALRILEGDASTRKDEDRASVRAEASSPTTLEQPVEPPNFLGAIISCDVLIRNILQSPDRFWHEDANVKAVLAENTRCIQHASKPTEPVTGLLDPDMPAQQLRLHMGEMDAQEERTARAAIRWANTRQNVREYVALTQDEVCEELAKLHRAYIESPEEMAESLFEEFELRRRGS